MQVNKQDFNIGDRVKVKREALWVYGKHDNDGPLEGEVVQVLKPYEDTNSAFFKYVLDIDTAERVYSDELELVQPVPQPAPFQPGDRVVLTKEYMDIQPGAVGTVFKAEAFYNNGLGVDFDNGIKCVPFGDRVAAFDGRKDHTELVERADAVLNAVHEYAKHVDGIVPEWVGVFGDLRDALVEESYR